MTVCTRFAPSPTGMLHIGSVRTALFSWLYARRHQGQFILRIEDTDRERSTQEAVTVILEGMQWLRLAHDQGPYYQTQRFDRYAAVIQQLLAEGKAYRCYCSKERLEQLRDTQMQNKEKPRYDGTCRHLTTTKSEPFVVRFKNPETGEVVVNDSVKGRVVFQNNELDDLIIARQDGTPTYNFTVVVDDWDMKVTHVIRGDDHLANTPRQMNILQALGAQIPQYGHVPMILGEDGKKLSKRHGAVSVLEYREQGYLPEAVLNYLVRLGWSHGDQEIFSIDKMIALFDMTDLNQSAAALNPNKLLWLNQHYLKTCDPVYVAQQLTPFLTALGVDIKNGPALTEVVAAQRERAKTLVEMAEKSAFFYQETVIIEAGLLEKHLKPEIVPALTALTTQLAALAVFTPEAIHAVVQQVAEQFGLNLGKLAQPVRIAVTGGTVSPPIDITLALLGKERVVERLSAVTK